MAGRTKKTEQDDLKIPRHLAVIMDGNGRWAKQHGYRRSIGHREGAESVRQITQECARLGVERLTLYAFSADNWKRPPREVRALMRLLKKYLLKERREIMDNNIRFAVVGRIAELPQDVRDEIDTTITLSRANTGMIMCLALNYGGREEIVDAARELAREVGEGERTLESITEEALTRKLYGPEPELLIRAGGDYRLSNFLLWQISYTELWVTPVMWPEFRKTHLHEALRDFSNRERRFGGLGE